jgi:hypothetical protein
MRGHLPSDAIPVAVVDHARISVGVEAAVVPGAPDGIETKAETPLPPSISE